ncbi:MAG: hypothetical protein IPG50_37290 [Myxococcales bacterium]|nr:hypothetical protein [Myxococcales bacterium]
MRYGLAGFVFAFAVLTPWSEALADDDGGDTAAMAANRGFLLGLAPTLLLPMRSGGPLGGGLGLEGRYGLRAGPTVLAPGGLLAGYGISGRFIGLAMPTFRVTLPVGPFAPFGVFGIGFGGMSNPGESGLAWLGGGGLMVHFGRVFAIGAEATYQTITGTEFHSVAIGPAIAFGG